MNSNTHQHNKKEEIDGRYYCTCGYCDSDYDSSEYDSEYDSEYSDYSSYSEYDDEDIVDDSDSYVDEEIWYDSDYFNENVYNLRPHSGWDSTSIPRNRYHLPESVLQNNENINFYVNNINNHSRNRNENLLDQPPVRHLLNSPNHTRQTTASSSATLRNPTGEEDSTDDNRTYIPNRHANQPVNENNTTPSTNNNNTNNNSTPNINNQNVRYRVYPRHRRRGQRHRHSNHPDNNTDSNRQNNTGNNNNNHNNDHGDDDLTRSNTNHSNRPRRSKRKAFFSHLMFVVALISTLALVLFVQLFGYILTAADQARDVTLRLTNSNRQQTVCDNNERTNAEDNNEESAPTNENNSSSIPNAEPDVIFTEENPNRANSQTNNNQDESNKSDSEAEVDGDVKENEAGKDDEKKKKEEKEKNDFLAHLSSLRAAQAVADQANPNNPNRVNNPTRLNNPNRVTNPSNRFSSYLSNYVYYNSDIYSP